MRILNKIEIQFTLNKRKATETHSTRQLKHSHFHRRQRKVSRRGKKRVGRGEEERQGDKQQRNVSDSFSESPNERDKKMCEKKHQKKVFKWTQNWLNVLGKGAWGGGYWGEGFRGGELTVLAGELQEPKLEYN